MPHRDPSVPVYWLAKEGRTCARCRWDEQYVEDLVSGNLKRPDSWWPPIDHREVSSLPRGDFAVVCFPAGAHADADVAWLNRELAKLGEVILFITSDEASRFPIDQIRHRRLHLWVMEPRPEIEYPAGTHFLGCGSARAGKVGPTPPLQRVTPLWFVGQVNHVRREQMVANSASWPEGSVCDRTDGFLEGMPREDYLADMAAAKVVACPSGVQSQDSFRLHEALDLGCVPLADMLRPDYDGEGYWKMVMGYAPFPQIRHWTDIRGALDLVLDQYPWFNILCHSWWHDWRREMARDLRRQMPYIADSNHFTVVIPTSPIKAHPHTGFIQETVESIRERTDAEILIMMDGVRPEQWSMRDAYAAYMQQLCSLCEKWDNVTPVWYKKFLHQAEMLSQTLDLVDTDYVLFVEHDTPLVGEIDFDEVMKQMELWGLNCMRFYHEVAIHPEHAHLMLKTGEEDPLFVRTMQWSQRPHLALRGWYREILNTYFDRTARTMIEDVMVGPLEHDWLVYGNDGWENWRMAIWTPDGDIKRSTHLDGRGGEPKHPMKFRYPGGKAPAGAPTPNKGGA